MHVLRSRIFTASRFTRWLVRLLPGWLLIATGMAQDASVPPPKDEFGSLVTLAPFVVSGKSLAISIYARTAADRRYGEHFAGAVVKVVHEAVTESTGRGLVIIGAKGEPHPTLVFRKFLALARDGKLDPAVAARGPEVSAMVDRWMQNLSHGGRHEEKDGEGNDFDFEQIFTALPLPLAGVGAKLYQIAWEEKFDEGRVEAKLRALRRGDLEQRDRFKAYEWVFYLPPKGAFDRVLNDLVAAALQQEDVGVFTRVAAKGVLLVLKPKIRRTIEAMRQGLMFMTVVQTQTTASEEDVGALTAAYIEVMIPFVPEEKKPPGRTEHERAVNAVRAQLRKNAEEPKESTDAATEGLFVKWSHSAKL